MLLNAIHIITTIITFPISVQQNENSLNYEKMMCLLL